MNCKEITKLILDHEIVDKTLTKREVHKIFSALSDIIYSDKEVTEAFYNNGKRRAYAKGQKTRKLY